jgi:hypothetical protein
MLGKKLIDARPCGMRQLTIGDQRDGLVTCGVPGLRGNCNQQNGEDNWEAFH